MSHPCLIAATVETRPRAPVKPLAPRSRLLGARSWFSLPTRPPSGWTTSTSRRCWPSSFCARWRRRYWRQQQLPRRWLRPKVRARTSNAPFEPESSLSPCVIVCPSPQLTRGLTIPPSLLRPRVCARFVTDSGSFLITPGHSTGPLLSASNIYAHLQRPRPRSENPGVGGSIPSQPTIVFSPAGNDLARAARTRRARRALLTRTVLELTCFVRVAFVRGMTGAAGAWVSWSVWSFAAPSFRIASSTIA